MRAYANLNNLSGSNNTSIGYEAGKGTALHSKNGNVFIGYQAGYYETGHYKLYINNSSSAQPLIYGEFDNYLLSVFGNLGVGTRLFGNGTRTLALVNGIPPTTKISDGVLLYAEDESASSELKVRDEANQVTTLSPHNFSMINKSEPMAWSFYSENHCVGKKINVDMLRVIRVLESISGEELVCINNIEDNSKYLQFEEPTNGVIQMQQEKIDQQQKEIDELRLMVSELKAVVEENRE